MIREFIITCVNEKDADQLEREYPNSVLVRCKDCKSWDKGKPFGGSEMCECKAHGGYFLPNDFCSDGERREKE